MTSVVPPARVPTVQLAAILGLTILATLSLPAQAGDTATNHMNLNVNPASGAPGSKVSITGSGFSPGLGTFFWNGVSQGNVAIAGDGTFGFPFKVPAAAPAGVNTLRVCWGTPCVTGEFEQAAQTFFTVTPAATATPSATRTATRTTTPIFTPTITLTASRTPTATQPPASGACAGIPPGAAVVGFTSTGSYRTLASYYYSSGPPEARAVIWSDQLFSQFNRRTGPSGAPDEPAPRHHAVAPARRASVVSPRSGAWTVLGLFPAHPGTTADAVTVSLRAYDAFNRETASASLRLEPDALPFEHCLMVAAPEIAYVRLLADPSGDVSGSELHFTDLFYLPGERTVACRDSIRFTSPADGARLGTIRDFQLAGEIIYSGWPASFQVGRPGSYSADSWTQDSSASSSLRVLQDADDPTRFTFQRWYWAHETRSGENQYQGLLLGSSCARDTEAGEDVLTVYLDPTATPTLTSTPTRTPTPSTRPDTFLIYEASFTQHGPFDARLSGRADGTFAFPAYLVARKDGALRLRALIGAGFFGTTPAVVHPVELQVRYANGSRRTYQAHHRAGERFESGRPFAGTSEMYFFLPDVDVAAGSADFELIFYWAGSVVRRQRLGTATFHEMPPQRQFYMWVDAPGDVWRYLLEVHNAARIFPVANWASTTDNGSGIVHTLSPTIWRLPRGTHPLLEGFLVGNDFTWDFVQDDTDARMVLARGVGRVVDCNGDGAIDGLDNARGWLLDADGDGVFDAGNPIPRGTVLGGWILPEDSNDDGAVSEAELADFIRWFYDLDGDQRWHDFRVAAERVRFSAGDPYANYADFNGNCRPDAGEQDPDEVTRATLRRDNYWGFMRSRARGLMLDYALRNGLPPMVTVALLPQSLNPISIGLIGNCGAGDTCWAALTQMFMTPTHEIGHFWGLQDGSWQIPGGALNLYETRWVEAGQTDHLMQFIDRGPSDMFLDAGSYARLFNRGRGGWRYSASVPSAGGPGLAAARPWQGDQAGAQRVLLIAGSVSADDEVLLASSYTIDIQAEALPAGSGDYRAELLDASGQVLTASQFSVGDPAECPDCPAGETAPMAGPPWFELTLPFPGEAATLRLMHGDSLLLTRQISPNPPTIGVVELPQTRVTSRDPIPLAWEASDPDGDELRYNLAFSADGGETYQTFEIGLGETTYTWDPLTFPGGTAIFLQVTASDGFQTASAEWGPLRLPDAPPRVEIVHPEPGAVIGRRDRLSLHALAFDLEDGFLDGPRVTWTDSTGRRLGEGARFVPEALPAGPNLLTVRAVDGAKQVAEAQVEITIIERPLPNPMDTLDLPASLDPLPPHVKVAPCGDGFVDLTLRVDPAEIRAGSLAVALFPPGAAPDGGQLVQTADEMGDGVYTTRFSLPEDARPGEWRMFPVALDQEGRSRRGAEILLQVGACAAGSTPGSRLLLAIGLGAAGLLLVGLSGLGVWRVLRRQA